jgi:peroxiredoxin
MLYLATRAPDCSRPHSNGGGRAVGLADFAGAPALLVAFICNHCPYVKHINAGLVQFARDYQPKGLAVVAISSNDVRTHPDDSPERMTEVAQREGYAFPYLYDETQAIAKAYRAACTPDLFLFDKDRRLVYRGQFDGSRPGSGIPVTGEDLRAAADAVLAGEPVAAEQRPSLGCNIKWKTGQEPDYYAA